VKQEEANLERVTKAHALATGANADAVARIERINEELLNARTEEQHAFEIRMVWEEVMALRSTADLADPVAHALATEWLEWLRIRDALDDERAELDERADALADELRGNSPEALHDEIRRLHAKADALSFELSNRRSKDRARLKQVQEEERVALEAAGFSSYLDFALESSTHKPLDANALQAAADERMLREAEIGDARQDAAERSGNHAGRRVQLEQRTTDLLGEFPDSAENAVEALWAFHADPPELPLRRNELAAALEHAGIDSGERPEDVASAWLAEARPTSVEDLLAEVAEASGIAEESGSRMEGLEQEIAAHRVELEQRRSWVSQAQRTADDLSGKHRGFEATFVARPYAMWNEEDLRLALQRLRGRPEHSERPCILTQDAFEQNPAVFDVACSIVGRSGVAVVGNFTDVPRFASTMESVRVIHLEQPVVVEATVVPEPEPVLEVVPEPEPEPEPEPVLEVVPEPEPVLEVTPEPEPETEQTHRSPWADLKERFVPMSPPIPREVREYIDSASTETRSAPEESADEEAARAAPVADDATMLHSNEDEYPHHTADWSSVPYDKPEEFDPYSGQDAPPIVPGAGLKGFCVECGASGKHVRLVELPRRGRPKVCVNCALKVSGVRSRHRRF
ncbi:MAG: hypothetical protein WBD02_00720, partial [Acidimicrobiia bacterium]